MALSMFQSSIPVFIKTLTSLKAILDKGAAHAQAKKIDETVLLQSRLYPDMLQRRLDVKGHDVRCVKLLQSLKILGSDSFGYLLDLLANRGFVYLALQQGVRHCSAACCLRPRSGAPAPFGRSHNRWRPGSRRLREI